MLSTNDHFPRNRNRVFCTALSLQTNAFTKLFKLERQHGPVLKLAMKLSCHARVPCQIVCPCSLNIIE